MGKYTVSRKERGAITSSTVNRFCEILSLLDGNSSELSSK